MTTLHFIRLMRALSEATPNDESHLTRIVWAMASALALGVACITSARFLTRRDTPSGFGSIHDIRSLMHWPKDAAYGITAVVAFGVLLLVIPQLRNRRVATASLGVAALGTFGPFLFEHGRFASIITLSVCVATIFALLFELVGEKLRAPSPNDRGLGILAFLIVFVVGSVFSVHRFEAYGAGSWDHGCMVHNFYRAAHGLDSISTVLGGVDYLGDHFMIGIYLYAPLVWIYSGGELVLLIQAANLAAVAPAVFAIARLKGADRRSSFALALAAGFSFGNQSGMFFDSHEITVGFGFLALTVWAIEADRLWLASVGAALFALFKESLGAYVVGLGLLLVARALTEERPKRRLMFGLGFITTGFVWFVLVNRVFMPALIARGKPPEPHETFADFGPTVFAALQGILTNPIVASLALFVPSAKVVSQLVTLLGTGGGLAVFAPTILIPALPLLAERFLSSKSTMWEMGYHYGASLCFYAAWATALALPKVNAFADRVAFSWSGRERLGSTWTALFILAMAGFVNEKGYHHSANFHVWNLEYFASPEKRSNHDGAIDWLRRLPKDAKIAAQNRLLPHVADRPFIYRLGDQAEADHVLLSVGDSAWPWDDGFPERLARTLSKTHKLTYSAGSTAIFSRPDVPFDAVSPSPALDAVLRR